MTDAIEPIRRAHRSAMPNPVANPAWANAERDIGVLLGEIDRQADLIERQIAEIDRLRKLDAEYGTVEAAIIMADPRFDGDSDHPSCGARLIASVNRMGQVYQRSLSNKGKGDE